MKPPLIHPPVPLLDARDLTIGYPRRAPIARDLRLTLNAGELVCLLGANGAGKSTLMRTLSAEQAPLSGSVWLNVGDSGYAPRPLHTLSLAERARALAFVLTERPDADLRAYDLAALGRHPYTGWLGVLTAEDEAAVAWALEAVNAVDLAGRRVGELSDGERQRVMIARALAQDTPLLFLDEPTAFLDFPNRVEALRLLATLAHDPHLPRAILLSTHDLDLAIRFADRLWLLADGRIEQGKPDELLRAGAVHRAFRLGAEWQFGQGETAMGGEVR